MPAIKTRKVDYLCVLKGAVCELGLLDLGEIKFGPKKFDSSNGKRKKQLFSEDGAKYLQSESVRTKAYTCVWITLFTQCQRLCLRSLAAVAASQI